MFFNARLVSPWNELDEKTVAVDAVENWRESWVNFHSFNHSFIQEPIRRPSRNLLGGAQAQPRWYRSATCKTHFHYF